MPHSLTDCIIPHSPASLRTTSPNCILSSFVRNSSPVLGALAVIPAPRISRVVMSLVQSEGGQQGEGGEQYGEQSGRHSFACIISSRSGPASNNQLVIVFYEADLRRQTNLLSSPLHPPPSPVD